MSLTEQIVIVDNNTDNINSISTLDDVGATLMFPKKYMDNTNSILVNDYDNSMNKKVNLTATTTNEPNDTHSTGHSTGRSTPDLYDANFPSLSSNTSTASSTSSTTTINYSSIVNSNTDCVSKNDRNAIVTENLELAASQHNNPQQQKRSKNQKNQAAEIIRRVMERTNTKINVDPGAKSSVVTFLIEGKDEDVANAKRILIDKLGLKDEITIQVPASARSHLLGPRGTTLKSITNSTGARITLPPRSKNPREEMRKSELDYDEDEEMMNVTIFGEMCAVCKAKVEIQDLIKSMCATKRTHYIKHIESKFYPLIAGAHNQRINQLGLDTGTKIHVPSYNPTNSNNTFIDADKNYIVITGERNSVKIASEMIEDRYEDLKINTRTLKFEIPKRQHKYLIGPKGATLQEILETTGCILELPPATDPSANVTIHGPQNQLADAIKTVMKKANSMHVQILDITDLHHTENPMKHSINILKYLWNRSKLKNVESKTGVKIVTPKITASAETEMKNLVMEFVSKVPEDVENARKEITEIIKNLPPSYFDVVEINPKFHRHVIGRKGQNLQRVKDAYGVEIIVPDEKEANPEILIVFEGRKGVKEFSDRKKKELYIKEIMEKVKNELLKVERDSSSDFSTQTLVVPVKYHRHIIGPKGINLNAIIHNDNGSGCSSVSVKFGSSKYSGVDDRSSNAQEVSDDSIIVKGPVKEVERIVEEINEKVEDIKRVENMKSFTAEFTIPAIYSSHIIGKGGSKIKFIRENYNVRIDIDNKNVNKSNSGNEEDETVNVKIVGMKVYVEEARSRILDTIDKLQEENVVCVNISPHYHASLIGAKGKTVRNLEVKHGVRIKFPRNKNYKNHPTITPSISSDIDEDVGDGDEGEGEFEREFEQNNEEDLGLDPDVEKSDEVLIIGGKRGVSEARTELLDLLHYAQDHDNILSFTIPAKCLPHVVGKNGRRIKEIKTDTFTKIYISKPITLNVDDSNDDNNNKLYEQVVRVNVRGNKRDNIKAQNKILEIVEEFEKQTTIIMNIDPKHHKFLIGPGGNRIKEVIAKAGGPEDKSSQAGIVKFPRLDDGGSRINEVVIKGSEELVKKIKEEFEILIEEQENLIIDIIKVPRNEHSVIIGRNGSQLHNIQNKFNVELYFPGSRSYNQITVTQKIEQQHEDLIDNNDLVKIVGKVEDIKLAKEEILSKLRYEYVFKFPCKFYSIINNNGFTSRKLRNEYHVMVENQEDEWKQTSTIINKKPNFKKSTKVIFEVEEEEEDRIENVKEKKSKEISWTLKGVKGQVDQAVKYLNELLEQAVNECTGYLSIPQMYHGHIIGRRGSTISHIRAESRCKIDVLKVNGDDMIVIIGSKENIMIAKNMIFEVLINLKKEQNSRKS
ncbi:13352_t:CDS:2 [Entrophospora sp. SA101]|nr:4217_t:CDS:2 [Entrophospora sp. SA101]CAJ0824456.1 15644_t:CDS:2 [Entrophospora sp. SA101]CAJ0831293.1 13352_t:CDS:2 [Entrophospora sp. SA101]